MSHPSLDTFGLYLIIFRNFFHSERTATLVARIFKSLYLLPNTTASVGKKARPFLCWWAPAHVLTYVDTPQDGLLGIRIPRCEGLGIELINTL